MFDIFFERYPGYTIVQQPTQETLNDFKDRLPAQLMDFWKTYGFGIFMNGYLKLVDPTEFQPVFDEAYDNRDNETSSKGKGGRAPHYYCTDFW